MSGYDFKLVIMSATLQERLAFALQAATRRVCACVCPEGDLFTRYFSEKKIKTIFVGVKRPHCKRQRCVSAGMRQSGEVNKQVSSESLHQKTSQRAHFD